MGKHKEAVSAIAMAKYSIDSITSEEDVVLSIDRGG
jgi:hypothetical protein